MELGVGRQAFPFSLYGMFTALWRAEFAFLGAIVVLLFFKIVTLVEWFDNLDML